MVLCGAVLQRPADLSLSATVSPAAAMYGGGHAQAKLGPAGKGAKGAKGCSYYFRIVFFFSSLIQSLIIVSLVLFLVYGNPARAAEQKKIAELEQNFNRLNDYNMKLKKDNGSLGDAVNALTAEKASLQKEVQDLKSAAKLHKQLMEQKRQPPPCPVVPVKPPPTHSAVKSPQIRFAPPSNELEVVKSNFTRTVHILNLERNGFLKDRDAHRQEVVNLQRENTKLKEQIVSYTRKCAEDFASSLNGIQKVTKAFLDKINTLFSLQTFHITCEKQHERMENIRTGCTNLSREIEDKFQQYLNRVGDTIAQTLLNATIMEAKIAQLTSDLKQCPNTIDARRQLQV